MKFLDNYFKYEIGLEISGLTEQLNIFYLLKLYEKYDRNIIVLTSSLYEANKIYNLLSNYLENSLIFPMDDFLSSMIVASSPELKYKRLETLDKLKSKNKYIIVTNLMGYLKFLPSKNVDNSIVINKGEEIKRDNLVNSLVNLGYHIDSLVTASGEISVRGFIVDIYPIDEAHPIRVEFDGNMIESIRYFDENTQLSCGNKDSITIKAIDEMVSENNDSLFNYANNPIVVYIDKSQIDASYKKLVEDIFDYKTNNNVESKLMYDIDDIDDKDKIFVNLFETSKYNLGAKSIENYNQDFEKLVNDYNSFKKSGKEIYFYLSNDKQARKIKDLISDANIVLKFIGNGFILDKYVVIGENDIEKVNHQVNNYKNNFHIGKRIKDFNQLEKGDYVVHVAHGIGVYNGITTLTIKGAKKDFLTINYAGLDKIYV